MRSLRPVIVLLLAASIVAAIALAACAAQVTSEIRVYTMGDWTLYGRTATGEPLSFNPYYVLSGTSWVPSGPAKTYFPALESGEVVRVTWTLDAEGRRRVDAMQIVSPLEGTTKGIVNTTASTQLVIRPKDEPGTVTLNPRYVLVEGRWIPDPVIARKLVTLVKGSRVTVRWAWDKEGRKRVVGIVTGW